LFWRLELPCGSDEIGRKCACFGLARSVIEEMDVSGTGKTNYAFTGESYDPQTGLTYLRARYYSAGQGRFISQDTWTGDAKQPLSYNRLAYGYDNPVRFVDPLGKSPFVSESAG
jgi:RHS repeat-associated protein